MLAHFRRAATLGLLLSLAASIRSLAALSPSHSAASLSSAPAVPVVTQPTYYLASVEAAGMKRLTARQVVAISGLKTGRMVVASEVESARMRLVNSGLFTSVTYRYRQTGYRITVVFAVEEPPWLTPVLFDNFVGMEEAELRRAVAADLPSFDGVVPEVPAALERVRGALEKLAREKGEPGSVNYLLVDDRLLDIRRYRFRLDRQSGPLPICSVEVQTAPDTLRGQMLATTKALLGSDYSADYVLRHAMQNLLPPARREGFLRARVLGLDAQRQPPGLNTSTPAANQERQPPSLGAPTPATTQERQPPSLGASTPAANQERQPPSLGAPTPAANQEHQPPGLNTSTPAANQERQPPSLNTPTPAGTQERQLPPSLNTPTPAANQERQPPSLGAPTPATTQERQPPASLPSTGQQAANTKCSGGVRVVVFFDAGQVYTWRPARWSANTIISSADLDRHMGLAPGDVASAARIEEGMKAVVDAYRGGDTCTPASSRRRRSTMPGARPRTR